MIKRTPPNLKVYINGEIVFDQQLPAAPISRIRSGAQFDDECQKREFHYKNEAQKMINIISVAVRMPIETYLVFPSNCHHSTCKFSPMEGSPLNPK